jgi:hypothetical protein
VDDPVWVATVFSKNRDRLLDGDIAAAFLSAVLNLPPHGGQLRATVARPTRFSELLLARWRSRHAHQLFDIADEALAFNEIATNWLRNNVLEFTKGIPEVMAGNALVAEFKNQ